jgi:hypothetical protein
MLIMLIIKIISVPSGQLSIQLIDKQLQNDYTIEQILVTPDTLVEELQSLMDQTNYLSNKP